MKLETKDRIASRFLVRPLLHMLVRALVLAGADIRAVETSEHTLEDVYLELLESAKARSDDVATVGSKR